MTTAADRGTVLMDLDGTISDPAGGIFSAFRYAVASVGRPWPDDRPLDWIIGPPLRESFGEWLGDPALGVQALEYYRENYAAEGLYDSALYPGMKEAIVAIGEGGFRLFVATSKLTQFAELIVKNFGLSQYFAGIYGSSLDGKIDQKTDIIAQCLMTERVDPTRCIMVGDRKHDAIGAIENGLACIGVAWGYGGVEELRAAKVKAICERPAALPEVVAAAMG